MESRELCGSLKEESFCVHSAVLHSAVPYDHGAHGVQCKEQPKKGYSTTNVQTHSNGRSFQRNLYIWLFKTALIVCILFEAAAFHLGLRRSQALFHFGGPISNFDINLGMNFTWRPCGGHHLGGNLWPATFQWVPH